MQRTFEIGRFYLSRPASNGKWYRTWYEAPSRRIRRVTLKTSDFEEAKARLLDYVRHEEMPSRPSAVRDDWKDVAERLCKRVKSSGRRRGLDFALDPEYLYQRMERAGFRCPICGVPLAYVLDPAFYRHPWAPSVDRIDSGAGYIYGNVRVVSLIANLAMNKWGADVLLRFANGVVESSFRAGEPTDLAVSDRACDQRAGNSTFFSG